MEFFDERKNAIEWAHWLKIYESQYFLDRPTTKIRSQGSRFVENHVCALLDKTSGLSEADLKLLMAWKLGAIHHRDSEIAQEIKYHAHWDIETKDRYGNYFGSSIGHLADDRLQRTACKDPEYLFKLHPQLGGFGPVYIIAVLFFVTQGRYPIYDRFAHIAVQAIHQGLSPGSYISYKPVQRWRDYEDYIKLLSPIGQACCRETKNSSMLISRPVDRALWVYGHFFKSKHQNEGALARPVRSPASEPAAVSPAHEAVSSDEVLVGMIRDLAQNAANGWRRREIIVKQTASGYPQVGQRINLADASGKSLGEFPFIKGAGKTGYTCLGKPGLLSEWFVRRYPFHRVATEAVYFAQRERQNEYRIYSRSEWEYFTYWSKFDRFLKNQGATFRIPTPPRQHFHTFSVGLPGIKLQPLIRFGKRDIGIDLYVTHGNSKEIFDLLNSDRASIEAEFGQQLQWRRMSNNKGCVIALRTDLDPNEAGRGGAQYEWLLDHLLRFKKVFVPRISALLLDDTTIREDPCPIHPASR
jgi:hypothetical protein